MGEIWPEVVTVYIALRGSLHFIVIEMQNWLSMVCLWFVCGKATSLLNGSQRGLYCDRVWTVNSQINVKGKKWELTYYPQVHERI